MMQNTTLEMSHMIQKLIKSGWREDALPRAKMATSRSGKPICPPIIWKVKKRDNNGGREYSSFSSRGAAARLLAEEVAMSYRATTDYLKSRIYQWINSKRMYAPGYHVRRQTQS